MIHEEALYQVYVPLPLPGIDVLQVSLSLVGWRSLFKERHRWRTVLAFQLILLLMMPALLMTVGIVSLLQRSTVKSVYIAAAVFAVERCPSVCHTPVLCLND